MKEIAGAARKRLAGGLVLGGTRPATESGMRLRLRGSERWRM